MYSSASNEQACAPPRKFGLGCYWSLLYSNTEVDGQVRPIEVHSISHPHVRLLPRLTSHASAHHWNLYRYREYLMDSCLEVKQSTGTIIGFWIPLIFTLNAFIYPCYFKAIHCVI